MYIYHFTQYAGTDRVFTTDQELGQAGDLVILGKGAYGLLLGEQVAWQEQTNYTMKPLNHGTIEIIHKKILRKQSLHLLHGFVNERYTTYKNSIPLWLHDIEDIVKRQEIRKKKQEKSSNYLVHIEDGRLVQGHEMLQGQQLLVFPDLWTLQQCVNGIGDSTGESYNPSPPAPLPKGEGSYPLSLDSIAILHSKSTKKQKSEVFWGIKTGVISTVLCTYSQIFQDRDNLQQITLVDQHKWYYKSHQDPRYYVPTVIQKLADACSAILTTTGPILSSCKEII